MLVKPLFVLENATLRKLLKAAGDDDVVIGRVGDAIGGDIYATFDRFPQGAADEVNWYLANNPDVWGDLMALGLVPKSEAFLLATCDESATPDGADVVKAFVEGADKIKALIDNYGPPGVGLFTDHAGMVEEGN